MQITHQSKGVGPWCDQCGAPRRRHVGKRDQSRWKNPPRAKERDRIIFIDGEGQGRKPHLYNFMAAADEFGKVWELGDNPRERLKTEDCLDFILSLPLDALIFGFGLMYDFTKMLTDVDNRALYLLFHEKRRQILVNDRLIYRAVKWNGYRLNYQNRRFTVVKGNRRATVWDVFAFFQSKFTKACEDWKVAPTAELEEMERMKEKRSVFDAQHFAAIKAYCIKECTFGASLGRKLLDAHDAAGITLKDFFGAGSTSSALLTKHDVKSYIDDVPERMKEAVACAFFGGRFENSVIGPIKRPVWNADIASAYPYAATQLPCLTHGRWNYCRAGKLDGELENAQLALIQWHLPPANDRMLPWGPLPVRKADGTIAFPLGSRSGWTWRDEFLAARTMRPDILALGAWLYKTDCNCRPFSFLPAVYLERLKIGKDGAGIVLKLGSNSVYGKLVQNVGWKPPFQCFVWGGNITSTCRAQLLQAIAVAPSPDRILAFATDGVWSDCPLDLPLPVDTGTENSYGKPPLGGWEVKDYPRGLFLARPGIYFPLSPSQDDLQKVRARGLGRRVLYEAHKKLTEAWDNGDDIATIHGGQRFIGAKTGLDWTPRKGVKRSRFYGEWLDWPIEVTFDPRPKRCAVDVGGKLRCWEYFDAPTLPYENAFKSDEDKLLMLAQLIAEEQPGAEFLETEE